MTEENKETPENETPKHTYGVPKILPPYVFAAGLAAIYFLGKWETGTALNMHMGGAAVMLLAVAFAFSASRQFKRVSTTILPGDQPSTMVTSGPFKHTRNPMYVAMTAFLCAFWSWTGGFSPFAVVIAFVMIIQHRFIRMEEQHMLQEFGEEYLAYCARTRRWL